MEFQSTADPNARTMITVTVTVIIGFEVGGLGGEKGAGDNGFGNVP